MSARDLHKLWDEVLPNFKKDINFNSQSDQKEAVKTLASLTNIKRVKYLAWEPEVTREGDSLYYHDGTLKGEYFCIYKEKVPNQKSDYTTVAVSCDWAERNFFIIALAYAQHLGYQLKKRNCGANIARDSH